MAFRTIFKCFTFRLGPVPLISTFVFCQSRCLNNYRMFLDMNTVYFQHDLGDDKLSIQLLYCNKAFNVTKMLSFERKISESLEKFLTRLNWKVEETLKRKTKKKKVKDDTVTLSDIKIPETLVTQILVNDEPVPNETAFEELLLKFDSKKLKLRIQDDEYEILLNCPMVSTLELPEVINVGSPVTPIKFEHKCIDEDKCIFTWYKKCGNDWVKCGNGYSYVPTEEDEYHKLKLTCLPRSGKKTGPMYEVISERVVVNFEFGEEIKKRQIHTKSQTEKDEIRIITYNILADLYTNTKEAKTSLFTYCAPKILDITYRTGLLYKEFHGYNADIICLQEVEKKFFKSHIYPFLKNYGFFGVFNEKEGTKEGCATFFRNNKFKIIGGVQYTFAEELANNPLLSDLKERINGNKKLTERINAIPTQLQITVLDWLTTSNDVIVLGNTHLYFHPDADHIRLLQGIIAFRLILEVVKEQKRMNPEKNLSILFCGDFNSTPDCGIYQLMTKGSVDNSMADWKSNAEEAIEGVSFSHDLTMKSACGTPQFTNYTQGFKACLDYIYFQTDRLSLKSFVPLPDEDILSKEVGIPSSYFPSDHVALIADLKLKT